MRWGSMLQIRVSKDVTARRHEAQIAVFGKQRNLSRSLQMDAGSWTGPVKQVCTPPNRPPMKAFKPTQGAGQSQVPGDGLGVLGGTHRRHHDRRPLRRQRAGVPLSPELCCSQLWAVVLIPSLDLKFPQRLTNRPQQCGCCTGLPFAEHVVLQGLLPHLLAAVLPHAMPSVPTSCSSSVTSGALVSTATSADLPQAVEMFLDERIKYADIVKVVEATCEVCIPSNNSSQRPDLQVI